MCQIINKLEELYNDLPETPSFEDLYIDDDGEYTYYKVDEGKFKSRALLNIPDISIAKSFITKGSTVERHQHCNSYEIIIVLLGHMSVILPNQVVKSLKQYDHIIIEKQTPHSVTILEDTSFIAITVPKDEGFPR